MFDLSRCGAPIRYGTRLASHPATCVAYSENRTRSDTGSSRHSDLPPPTFRSSRSTDMISVDRHVSTCQQRQSKLVTNTFSSQTAFPVAELVFRDDRICCAVLSSEAIPYSSGEHANRRYVERLERTFKEGHLLSSATPSRSLISMAASTRAGISVGWPAFRL